MKYIVVVLKRLILGFVILYGYNMIAVNFNMVMPINVVTVALVSLLGFPALFALVLLCVLVY